MTSSPWKPLAPPSAYCENKVLYLRLLKARRLEADSALLAVCQRLLASVIVMSVTLRQQLLSDDVCGRGQCLALT